MLNSKVLSVTIKPTPVSLSAPVAVEFSHLYNVSDVSSMSVFALLVITALGFPGEAFDHSYVVFFPLGFRAPLTSRAYPGTRVTGTNP